MPSPGRLTILHLTAPAVAGGLESVVLELAGGLVAAGHRVVVGAVLDAGSGRHPFPVRAAAAGAEVRTVFVGPRAYRREYRGLQGILAEVRPDLVHTHGYRADLIGGLAARWAGVPWISTVHGFAGGDRKNRFYEWLQVQSYRRASAVVAVSAPIRVRLGKARLRPDHIHLVPNAWSSKSTLSRGEARGRLGLDPNEFVIGWVGRLSREKGADIFLESLALLSDRRWRACILGDGDQRLRLEAQARELGIAHRITWAGLVADAAGLYPAFDCWALSSRTEGTPIALFEAMAARVPAVVTAVGGVPDVVSAAEALSVPSEAPERLAGAIEAIRANPAAAHARAESAHRRLLTQFSTVPWVQTHEQLYRELCTFHPGQPR